MLKLVLLFCLPLIAKIDLADWPIEKAASVEEALFLRRIADFWQEREYGIAKNQMEKFLDSFPNSQFCDPLRSCLGDILLREKNYSGALSCYSSLSAPEFIAKASRNQMQCLYNLEWYPSLADKCEESLALPLNPEARLETTLYLAIALYHQCLNATKDSEALLKLAKRAEPHFETLLKSSLSEEVSQAFAHLSCILGAYEKAADIYLRLAKDPALEDEMTFQAALIQAEFNKSLSLASFASIAKSGGKRAQEASYNHLILSFGEGLYEEIVKDRESILALIPEGQRGAIPRLYLGKSLLALKRYGEAIEELTPFLKDAENLDLESTRSCFISLVEAAHQSGDAATMDSALLKLSEIDPTHTDLAKGKFLKALLLKTLLRNDEARIEFEDLIAHFPHFPDKGTALFEWADLEYRAAAWESCRARSLEFLREFRGHERAIHAWRYLGAASSHLLNQNSEKREQFVKDLETLLEEKGLFSLQEVKDWSFYLARGYFELGLFEKAIHSLKSLFVDPTPFSQEANAHLLLGFCYRDAFGDLAGYCSEAEIAMAHPDLEGRGLLHLSLFNAYLKLSQEVGSLIEMSAKHLYEALLDKADISKENLLWLGDWYLSKGDGSRATLIFSKILEMGFDETACYKIGKLHAAAGRIEDQVAVLEKLLEAYKTNLSENWLWEDEAKLILALGYTQKGFVEKALQLLEEIGNGISPLHSETVAKAYFEKAKILLARFEAGEESAGSLEDIASRFKDLTLQRRLESEPVHFESALEYVFLIAKEDPQKRLSLLEKTERDFTSEEDILSKDYHQARLKYPDKSRLYEAYMRFIDVEILIAKSEVSTDIASRKELQAKSKDLLLQIKRECDHPTLLRRVLLRLQDDDVSAIE